MLVAVWRKKTCSIQFSLKNRALNFRGVFFVQPGIQYFRDIPSI